MKPAEITPLTSLKIAELMREAGMPDGVVNMVPGLGSVAGQYIAEHARHRARSRSPAAPPPAGSIVQASAGNLKKVQLELGGKGPNIVFDDANLPAAVNGSAWAIFHNQGQACIAGSRLMLHEKIADAFLDKFIAAGAVDPARQPARCRHRDGPAHQRAASRPRAGLRGRGARAGRRGAGRRQARPSGELARGCYVEPTVVRARVSPTASRRKRCSARSSPC